MNGVTLSSSEPRTIARDSDWRQRLDAIIATMREMSLQTEPQAMVQAYLRKMQQLMPVERRLSLSRRDLSRPFVRITRYSGWPEEINPWREPHRLPVLHGGILSQLIYADAPVVINDLRLEPGDPAYPYLEGQRSLMALPLFESGAAVNMVIATRPEEDGFREEDLPDRVWMANLFGRATQTVVLAERLREAYQEVDRELQIVANIQRSLLPSTMPEIATLKLGASYQTSRRAGGDYYDFFELSDDRWGILIADVSGHGTPAAVVMAVLHCIAHMHPGEPLHPARVLEFLNRELAERYTNGSGHFVTAFYGVFDARQRTLTYASAGHNPPRWRRCSESRPRALDGSRGLPLGIMPSIQYTDATVELLPGDRLVFYTDGIIEAANTDGTLFGVERLDHVVSLCSNRIDAQAAVEQTLASLHEFTDGATASDDRTLIIADVM